MKYTFLLLLAVTSRGAFALQRSQAEADKDHKLKRHMMTKKGLEYDGAVCLDGSDAGFYFAKASKERKNSWQILFEGGGWCSDGKECASRAGTKLGSSTSEAWAEYYDRRPTEGFLDRDCDKNPYFCDFNQIVVPYCDGTSFTGNVDQPVQTEDHYGMPAQVYLRGRRILDAVLDTLLTEFGLDQAEEVVVTGYSAGGLTSIIFADYIHDRLQASAPNLVKYASVPLSAFFIDRLWHDGDEGDGQYLQDSLTFNTKLLDMVELANASGSLPSRCVTDLGKNASQCIFAANAYKYSKSPTFIVNSGVDLFQIAFIMMQLGYFPESFAGQEWGASGPVPYIDEIMAKASCVSTGDCNFNQMSSLLKFQGQFRRMLSENQHEVGDGAFVHSCPLHTEALSPAWTTVVVKGVTMQQAVTSWFQTDFDRLTEKRSFLDCHVQDRPPYSCNPTCSMVHQSVA